MSNSFVFIDYRVADYQSIVATMAPDARWALLDPDQNGLVQMQSSLAGITGLDAIHVVSHGAAGTLYLGNTVLDASTLDTHRDALATIGRALTEAGDLLLYGCNVAQGVEGSVFIEQLGALTAADVAASVNVTGVGGDAVLEVQSGSIENSPLELADYGHSLAYGNIDVEWRNKSLFAALREDGSVVTWGGPDSSSVASELDGTVDVTHLYSTESAFAALRADGSVVTWGNPYGGGDSSAVKAELNGAIAVTQIFTTQDAFAALRADGSVITWGASWSGGNSAAVSSALDGTIKVSRIFSTSDAFAALREDGSVVTWGRPERGGDSSAISSALDGTVDVTHVASNNYAFAALRADGSVITWGEALWGGDNSGVSGALDGTVDVERIYSNSYSFAALRADGSVITWGLLNPSPSGSDDLGAVASALDGTIDVIDIYVNGYAFAALRADGSVFTWGFPDHGGNSSTVATTLDGTVRVTEIHSATGVFAALREDGSVVTWGNPNGGDSDAVADALDGTIPVTHIYTTGHALAALRADGSVITWGDSVSGGDSSAVASALDGTIDVIHVYANGYAFAALRADGSVVTWGSPFGGGDSSAVARALDGTIDVREIYSTYDTFAALRADGSVITWGALDSSAVADQLTSIVSLAGPQVNAPSTRIDGDENANNLIGTSGPNLIRSFGGNDTLNGQDGDDNLDGGAGNDTLDGGAGSDWASYEHSQRGVRVDLAAGLALDDGFGGVDTLISIENVRGSYFNDNLKGDAGSNHLQGLGGNDWLYGGAGNDTLDGGVEIDGRQGFDTADYFGDATPIRVDMRTGSVTQGADTDTLLNIAHVRGTSGNDFFQAGAAANRIDYRYISTGGGGEYFQGMGGNDTFVGGTHALDWVSIRYHSAPSSVHVNLAEGYALNGFGGTDSLTNIDEVHGSAFNDTLIGGSGNTYGYGNRLWESFQGNGGDDYIDGGDGFDRVRYSAAPGAVQVNLAEGWATGADGNDTLVNIEGVRGSQFNDLLIGSDADNEFEGLGGNDTIDGGAGHDILRYTLSPAAVSVTFNGIGQGTAFDGFGGIDTFTNIEAVSGSEFDDTFVGNAGNETFEGSAGNDTLDGGAGSDWASYEHSQRGVRVDLAAGLALDDGFGGVDTLISIENVRGSYFNDHLVGDAKNNHLVGSDGEDLLYGLHGNDILDGGAGADVLFGGAGNDLYFVDNPADKVFETTTATSGIDAGGIDTVVATVSYTLGNYLEHLILTGSNSINGTGNGLSNDITGNDAANVLRGAGGNDTLIGNAGNDRLIGGSGRDILIGGTGKDVLIGGAGNDIFKFNTIDESASGASRDVIIDFKRGRDKIDLSSIDADTTLEGDQSFGKLIVGGAFSGTFEHKAALYYDSVNKVLYGNIDADIHADFSIQLIGVTTLSTSDFIL